MKVFTHTKFYGFYPVGTSAVVTAPSAIAAAAILEAALEDAGLPQKINKEDFVEVSVTKPQAVILQDGNY